MPPMTTAEIRAPTRIETCCFQGVAPTRKPVLRSCEVVPPLDEAMQTIPAIDSAVRRYSGPTQPSNDEDQAGQQAAWRSSSPRSGWTTSRSRR